MKMLLLKLLCLRDTTHVITKRTFDAAECVFFENRRVSRRLSPMIS